VGAWEPGSSHGSGWWPAVAAWCAGARARRGEGRQARNRPEGCSLAEHSVNVLDINTASCRFVALHFWQRVILVKIAPASAAGARRTAPASVHCASADQNVWRSRPEIGDIDRAQPSNSMIALLNLSKLTFASSPGPAVSRMRKVGEQTGAPGPPPPNPPSSAPGPRSTPPSPRRARAPVSHPRAVGRAPITIPGRVAPAPKKSTALLAAGVAVRCSSRSQAGVPRLLAGFGGLELTELWGWALFAWLAWFPGDSRGKARRWRGYGTVGRDERARARGRAARRGKREPGTRGPRLRCSRGRNCTAELPSPGVEANPAMTSYSLRTKTAASRAAHRRGVLAKPASPRRDSS